MGPRSATRPSSAAALAARRAASAAAPLPRHCSAGRVLLLALVSSLVVALAYNHVRIQARAGVEAGTQQFVQAGVGDAAGGADAPAHSASAAGSLLRGSSPDALSQPSPPLRLQPMGRSAETAAAAPAVESSIVGNIIGALWTAPLHPPSGLTSPARAVRPQSLVASRFIPPVLPGEPLPDSEPVDAVYTWCNESDPLSRRGLAAAIDEAVRIKRHARAGVASSPNRFREWGELRFSMRSLSMFAPWLRTIYVVVAGPSQVPSWLDTAHPRIRVVYHDALFSDPATQLPSFNSFAIESVLHRIPGLSRHFLYLNNDLLLARPALLRHFRTATHFARLLDAPLTRAAECHQLLSMALTHTKTPSDPAFHDEVGMSCRSSPFFWDDVLARFYFSTPLTHWAPHVPRLWDREALELVEQVLGEHMTAVRRNRLRDRDSDVNVHMQMESLLQSHSGQGPDSPTVLSGKLRAQDVFYSVFQDNGKTVGSRNGAFAAAALAMGRPLPSRPRFFGLEDDLSPDVAQDTFDWTQQQMRETFTKFWGERAPWEKD